MELTYGKEPGESFGFGEGGVAHDAEGRGRAHRRYEEAVEGAAQWVMVKPEVGVTHSEYGHHHRDARVVELHRQAAKQNSRFKIRPQLSGGQIESN